LGVVSFVIKDDDAIPITIEWDDEGIAHRIISVSREGNCFSATRKNWRSFIHGEFGATAGLLRGELEFRGTIAKVAPYSLAFNQLATIARNVKED
jgi:putative sterol carrier protein